MHIARRSDTPCVGTIWAMVKRESRQVHVVVGLAAQALSTRTKLLEHEFQAS